jgi:hypothetical protein
VDSLRHLITGILYLCGTSVFAAGLGVSSFLPTGTSITNTFTNGVLTVERAEAVDSQWKPYANSFTTGSTITVSLGLAGAIGFYRPLAVDLSPGVLGFSNLVASYSLLSTIAGAGGVTGAGINKWSSLFEGGAATNAQLSRPHIAMTDSAGDIFIADKDAHGVRKIRSDGIILTVAGTSVQGNGPDYPTNATSVMLDQPNGLWVRTDGAVYILDLGNAKIRKLDTNGILSTMFTVTGLAVGRGIWVTDDESLAYVCSGTVVKKWTPAGGVVDFATGFSELGNLAVDPNGWLVVTDRGAHRVYRLSNDGNSRTIIAGNGTITGGGDNQAATSTGLNQVRGIWFLPTGAYLLGTDAGSQVWYVDTAGVIHLLLNGNSSSHAGDGSYFFNPGQARVSKVRQITMDYEGNLLITEHDAGYVRKVRFLRN